MEGQRKGSVYQAQHGVAGKRKDGVDQPFPNKPVSHRRPLNPGKQDSLDLEDFEKIILTEQPRGPSFPPKYHSDGIGKTTGSRQTRKDLHIETSGELKMARAIHEKELMLQEKLWSVEEKVRQKYQRYAAAHEDPKSREQRNNRGQAERGKVQTKGGLFEQQRREPVEREIMWQDRRQEDVKQLRRMQDQRIDDRISIKHEEERARWEKEVAQSQRKSHKGTHQTTVHEQEVSGEFIKSTRGNVKEHTGSKRGEEKGEAIWGKTGVRSQDGTVKTKERADTDWSRERKYKELYLSEDERDMPHQSSQHITSHKAATGNSRGAERKVSEGQLLPPVSHPSLSSRPEQGELRQEESTDTSLRQVPCSVCNRMFAGERLQKHLEICTKLKQSKRTVFNIYVHRTKGSAIEEYWKTHTKIPEVLKKKTIRHPHKTNISNLEESRLPTGTSKPKWAK
ncbi:hypothetical protein JOQ06_028332 [Pogonophryne albipinna]|uniref:C2HC/C3H-type domain-containing protein n=1 Tax=Pogonophryne albipinna TaxID=1090488 RepID=A0AAD6FLP2_9TELE|nr:hypothetical protein JOQ06_028332 [Pogonophryne albipinna]